MFYAKKYSLLSLLLSFLNLFKICSAQYYCIAAVGIGTNLQCVPPLQAYRSINRCCTQNQGDLGGVPPLATYQSEPPRDLPPDCVLAEVIGRRVVCTGQHTVPLIHWHDFFQNLDDIGICCVTRPSASTPSTVYNDRLAATPRDFEVPTIRPPGQPFPGPPPSQTTTTTRRPLPPIIPFRPGRISSAFCRDLNIPGRPSDCPANAQRCNDPTYSSLMAQQCPFTCNLCGRQQNPMGGGVFDRHIGGGRGCRDWITPSGHMSCQQMVANMYCQSRRTQMMAQCPLSCGFCTP